MINAIHAFFLFLGNVEGDLFKNFTYLLIFMLISYMIASEYNKTRKHEYKYLVVAFLALSLQAAVNVIVGFFVVFRGHTYFPFDYFIPIIGHAFELVGLVLLANAFLYPIANSEFSLKRKITQNIFLVSFFIILVQIFWLIAKIKNPSLQFNQYAGFGLFTVLKLFIVASPIYHIFFTEKKMKYKHLIYLAFVLYAISPLVSLFNHMFFQSTSARMDVFVQPWPFFSALMFTRSIYLKLVDKLYLKSKLKESNLKYLQEKELNAMKDEFVSVVSHELRTPLTSIKLYLSLMKNKKLGKTSKKQDDALNILSDETTRLGNLINDILDLNKLESNKVQLCLAKFDLNELKNPIYYGLAKEKKLVVKFNVIKKAKVTCDPDKIKQVYINLMSNAAKFTEKGFIKVQMIVKSNEWVLIVKDSGQGIAKKHLPKLFEKFYQVGDYMTRKVKGTGLGLSIVKKIVDLHKGTIEVNSKVGKGTTFILTFPKI